MADRDLVKLALEAHGLKSEHVLASKIRGSEVSIVTRGGQRIRWKEGDKPVEIPKHQHPETKPEVKEKKK
jgi:hypothetical protein